MKLYITAENSQRIRIRYTLDWVDIARTYMTK